MKNYSLYFILFFNTLELNAQKPPIDSSVFGKWPSVNSIIISNDGRYVLYQINNLPVGSNTLVIQSTENKWKQTFSNVDNGKITLDSKKVIFKNTGDSLCIGSLGSDEKKYISNVSAYQISKGEKGEWLGYLVTKPAKTLTLNNLISSRELIISEVSDFLLSDSGNILLFQTEDSSNKILSHSLVRVNLRNGKMSTIWRGGRSFDYAFDKSNKQLAFLSEGKNSDSASQPMINLWYYKEGMSEAVIKIGENCHGIDTNLLLSKDPPEFSSDGSRIFFSLIEKVHNKAMTGVASVDVWSYKDQLLQSTQLQYNGPKTFAALIYISNGQIIRMEYENEGLVGNIGDHALLIRNRTEDLWSDNAFLPDSYLISTKNGLRTILRDSITSWSGLDLNFPFSPHEKWYIYFDGNARAYFSYEISTGIKRNITRSITVPIVNSLANEQGSAESVAPVGIAAWTSDDSAVLIYDDYDIWKVDPAAVKIPMNVTNGYGRSHHIKFRLVGERKLPNGLTKHAKLLLTAFDEVNKHNGFYRVALGNQQDPSLLSMGPYNVYIEESQAAPHSLTGASFEPIKADDADVWIVRRMSASEAPNFFTTRDFKTFTPLSNLHPEADYNWLTAELVNWTMLDEKPSQGILFKPENFNPNLKYPLLITFYEKKSDGLYQYLEPTATGADINIPWFVSQGYLVFEPDIHYKIGLPGESAVNAIVSAAKYLSQKPWVDDKRIGINGHSWGGYETNYLLTHTQMFAAAAEASGPSDFVSGYGGLTGGEISGHFHYEVSQCRIGATLWQRPDLYIKNSPIFQVDQVTTPLLMMNNKKDWVVRFEQGIELFTALRRLNKKAWMLQYDNGRHGLSDENDLADYTIRLTQFFDHYLKGAPPPKWMTEGIPARLKGIETGYELDTSGKQP
jgi:dienelactone hydrolase